MKYSQVSYEDSGSFRAANDGETRLESSKICRLLLLLIKAGQLALGWLPDSISPSAVTLLLWNFPEIFFSFFSSISLLKAWINSAWIWSYSSRINCRANLRMLPAVSFSGFNAWIFVSFLVISSCRMICQVVMSAGVVVLLRKTSGRLRNLEKFFSGSGGCGSAAESRSAAVFSVLRPSVDARSVPGRSPGCLLSAPIDRARFH